MSAGWRSRSRVGRNQAAPTAFKLRIGLLLKSIRWRTGSSVVFLVVAVAAVAAATAGPLYLAAADQSILSSALRSAPVQQTSLTVFGPAGLGPVGLRGEVGTGPISPSGARWFLPPLLTEDVGLRLTGPSGTFVSDLAWRTQICRHLRFVSGHCPSGADEAAISVRSARLVHAVAGSRLRVQAVGGAPETIAVSGLYEPLAPQSAYFAGQNFFPFGTGSTASPRIGALIVQPAAIGLAAPTSLVSELQLPLERPGLRATDVPSLEAAISAMETHLGTSLGLRVTTQLPSLLSSVAAQQHSLGTSVSVIEVQLLLLVLLVLYGVSVRATEERRQELALADLRGLPAGSLAWLACREAAALTVAAVPLGLLVGWAVIEVVARAALGASNVAVNSLAVVACLAGGSARWSRAGWLR